MFNLYVWILSYDDTWHNKKMLCDILTKLIQNKI